MSIDRIPLIALLALVGCAEGREPDPTPMNDGGGYNLVDPVPTPIDPNPREVTAGAWSPNTIEGRLGIQFAPPNGEPVFLMFCDERDGLVMERRGIVPTGALEMMEISFAGAFRNYAVNELQTGQPALRASIPFNDDMLTRLRQIDTPLTVTVDRGQPLIMPATPLIPELVVACERREADIRTVG